MSHNGKVSGVQLCGHCGNRAPMEIVGCHSDIRRSDSSDAVGFDFDEGRVHEMLLCPNCKKIVLRTCYIHEASDDPEYGYSYEVLYPTPRKLPRGLPDKVEAAYESALRVQSIDANAFAVLLGRVLELVCVDRGANGDTLYKQLNDLASRGEIPATLADIANGLRNLRNVGAHASLGELTDKDVPMLDALARAIVEYVYTAPSLVGLAKRKYERLKAASGDRG